MYGSKYEKTCARHSYAADIFYIYYEYISKDSNCFKYLRISESYNYKNMFLYTDFFFSLKECS